MFNVLKKTLRSEFGQAKYEQYARSIKQNIREAKTDNSEIFNDLYEILRNAVFLVICVIACLPAPKRMFYRALERHPRLTAVASTAASLIILTLCVAYLVNSSYNPFLYFRF